MTSNSQCFALQTYLQASGEAASVLSSGAANAEDTKGNMHVFQGTKGNMPVLKVQCACLVDRMQGGAP
eukprot:1158842-Pelagomonas_calceolata.AAC.4